MTSSSSSGQAHSKPSFWPRTGDTVSARARLAALEDEKLQAYQQRYEE